MKASQMKKEFVLNEGQLERMGANSLIGLVYQQGCDQLEIIFEETSPQWRAEHGGPAHWVVPEYVISCLMADVLWLISQGVSVIVSTRVVDPDA
jgi:hypothetical protein